MVYSYLVQEDYLINFFLINSSYKDAETYIRVNGATVRALEYKGV